MSKHFCLHWMMLATLRCQQLEDHLGFQPQWIVYGGQLLDLQLEVLLPSHLHFPPSATILISSLLIPLGSIKPKQKISLQKLPLLSCSNCTFHVAVQHLFEVELLTNPWISPSITTSLYMNHNHCMSQLEILISRS